MHDRDATFPRQLDQRMPNLGLRVLQAPPRCPLEITHRLMVLEALQKRLITGNQPARKLKEQPEMIKGWRSYNQSVRQMPRMPIRVRTITSATGTAGPKPYDGAHASRPVRAPLLSLTLLSSGYTGKRHAHTGKRGADGVPAGAGHGG